MKSPDHDPRSVDELISAALSEPDEDCGRNSMWTLRWRGSREVFERASGLCRSFCPVERKLGVAILGQLGIPDRSFPKSCLGILLSMLEDEQDDGVIRSILFALAGLRMPEVIGPAARFRDDADPGVREGVVQAMMGHEDPVAIEVLIGLTRDQETYIRDWACFALGTQVEVDTPDVRGALAERLTDEDDDARCEAIVGLARRKDLRVIPPLLGALSSKLVWSLEVEAASLIADPRLYPELIALRGWWDVDEELLEEAILACSPRPEPLS
ncbi:HEAT repeat domain-containing protein [Singulisphaera acidiphila]|uniref:HEAT repeat-containing protein n=1 Tax=Singulisphaera acidiphila (strain ATCC BAA-1392 / DSM 18658 / VKM B-2454 / MOB10) TaxID=886293 RepID=L0DI73_SINAD|nr:HEAT repeat domain-containing protein [Singulisphaera acidiphila]AGA28555.1 HEAT repeat-containing protein [Singulisphaera acidiphila DSM 18658]